MLSGVKLRMKDLASLLIEEDSEHGQKSRFDYRQPAAKIAEEDLKEIWSSRRFGSSMEKFCDSEFSFLQSSGISCQYFSGNIGRKWFADPRNLLMNELLKVLIAPGSTFKIVTAIAAWEEGV